MGIARDCVDWWAKTRFPDTFSARRGAGIPARGPAFQPVQPPGKAAAATLLSFRFLAAAPVSGDMVREHVLHAARNQGRPAGLVIGAAAPSGIGVEELIEALQTLPVRVFAVDVVIALPWLMALVVRHE